MMKNELSVRLHIFNINTDQYSTFGQLDNFLTLLLFAPREYPGDLSVLVGEAKGKGTGTGEDEGD